MWHVWGRGEVHKGFGGKPERDHLEDLGVHGRHNIKTDHQENSWESVERINLAQNRGKWRALVKPVMNPRFP
jgi:hypothetical protein